MVQTYKGLTKEDYLFICQSVAKEHGGVCLSKIYVSVHSKLIWRCELGHTWKASPANIKSGKWCPTCSNNKKLSLDDCVIFAKSKAGDCLSDEYFNSSTLMTWKCKYGHIWKSNFNNIKSKNSWCPECATNIGEKICRLLFEQYFNNVFIKTKPEWLQNNGHKLELDGFCEELKIAFEYQGIQHYKIDGFFIKDELMLQKRMNDDLLKKELCAAHNIILIEFPAFSTLENYNNLVNEFVLIISKYGFKNDTKNLFIDLNKLYSSKIEFYKQLAIDRQGQCLSDTYVNCYSKLKWKCNKNHIWEAIGYSIEKGHWCPDCAGNKKGNKYPGFKNNKTA